MHKFDVSIEEIERVLQAFQQGDARKVEMVFETNTVKVYSIGENTIRIDVTKNKPE